MSQTPPILTLLLSPFLEVWAILLLFVQQLIYSLRFIFIDENNRRTAEERSYKETQASQINELIKQPSEGSDDFNELLSYLPFTFWGEKLER